MGRGKRSGSNTEAPRRRKSRRSGQWTDLFDNEEVVNELLRDRSGGASRSASGVCVPLSTGHNLAAASIDGTINEGILSSPRIPVSEDADDNAAGDDTAPQPDHQTPLDVGLLQIEEIDEIQPYYPEPRGHGTAITTRVLANGSSVVQQAFPVLNTENEEQNSLVQRVTELTTNYSVHEDEGDNDDLQVTDAGHNTGDVEANVGHDPSQTSNEMNGAFHTGKRRKLWSVMCNPANIAALLSVSSNMRMTVKHYNYMREMIHTVSSSGELPSYSYIQDVIWPMVVDNVFPKSTIENFNVSKGPQASVPNSSEAPCATKPVCVVLPSEWAKQDVGTTPFYTEDYNNTRDALEENALQDLRNCGMAKSRSSYVVDGSMLWGRMEGNPIPISPGSQFYTTLPGISSGQRVSDWASLGWSTRAKPGTNAFQVLAEAGHAWIVTGDPMSRGTGNANGIETCIKRVLHEGIENDLQGQTPGITRRSYAQQDIRRHISAGDVCCCLTPTLSLGRVKSMAVIISKFRKDRESDSKDNLFLLSEDLLHVLTEVGISFQATETLSLQFIKKFELRSTYEVVRNGAARNTPISCDGVARDDIGYLLNGEKYVVYRMLLYTDDFKPTSLQNPSGSVGGLYMTPCSLPARLRSISSGVRVISLTPPGVSTNEAMKFIVGDILTGTTIGFSGKNVSGEDVRIFLDVVGYVSDYPAMTHVTDVMGHNANSPCTHCTFRLRRERTGSKYGYSTAIHSRKSSNSRCYSNHTAIRLSKGSELTLKRLGMQHSDAFSHAKKPLIILARELLACRASIPTNREGLKVLSGIFDPYQSCAVAPDHLLYGLTKDLLVTSFKSLPREHRAHANTVFMDALLENGLMAQGFLFNLASEKLHPMSITASFSALTLAPAVFRISSNAMPGNILELIDSLSDLVAMIYWAPNPTTDGSAAHDIIEDYQNFKYRSSMLEKGKNYVTLVHRLCSLNARFGEELDKPNLHRVIELVCHTVPSYGCARNVSELAFEAAHQPLKGVLKRSTHNRAHITAVYHSLCYDWSMRLKALRNVLSSSKTTPAVLTLCRRALRRLVTGKYANSIDGTVLDEASSQSNLDEKVLNMLSGNILAPLWKSEKIEDFWEQPYHVWEAILDGRMNVNDESLDVSDIEKQTILAVRTSDCGDNKDRKIIVFQGAKRMSNVVSHQRRNYKHTLLKNGVAVQICEDDGENVSMGIRFYCLHCIVGFDKSTMWVGVTRLNMTNEMSIYSSRNCQTQEVEVFRLSGGVQRVAKVHACQKESGCQTESGKKIIHSAELNEGGFFYIFGRRQGYPPRMG